MANWCDLVRNPTQDKALIDRITSQGERLLEENGAAFSLRDVDRLAGVTQTVRTRLFPTKEALVAEVVRQDFNSLVKWGETNTASIKGASDVALWLDELTATLVGNPGLAELLVTALVDTSSALHGMASKLLDLTRLMLRNARPEAEAAVAEGAFEITLAAIWAAERLNPGPLHPVFDARLEAAARLSKFALHGAFAEPMSE